MNDEIETVGYEITHKKDIFSSEICFKEQKEQKEKKMRDVGILKEHTFKDLIRREDVLKLIEEIDENAPFIPSKSGQSYWYDKFQDLKQKLEREIK